MFADAEVTTFLYTGGMLDRTGYENLVGDVGEVHAPKLLRDLHDGGLIDLTDPSMCDVVPSYHDCLVGTLES